MPKSESLPDLLKLYKDHFIVLKIKEKYKIQNKFQFREVSPDEEWKIIQALNIENKVKPAISSSNWIGRYLSTISYRYYPQASQKWHISWWT